MPPQNQYSAREGIPKSHNEQSGAKQQAARRQGIWKALPKALAKRAPEYQGGGLTCFSAASCCCRLFRALAFFFSWSRRLRSLRASASSAATLFCSLTYAPGSRQVRNTAGNKLKLCMYHALLPQLRHMWQAGHEQSRKGNNLTMYLALLPQLRPM